MHDTPDPTMNINIGGSGGMMITTTPHHISLYNSQCNFGGTKSKRVLYFGVAIEGHLPSQTSFNPRSALSITFHVLS